MYGPPPAQSNRCSVGASPSSVSESANQSASLFVAEANASPTAAVRYG
eukprot:COSAG03_NODE_7705_length_882_cov_1.065134_2_plen_47_part_01